MPNDKLCEDLQKAPPEDLVEAFLLHIRTHKEGELRKDWFIRGIMAGQTLSQPGGWKHIAPQWLEDYRKWQNQPKPMEPTAKEEAP